MYRLDFVEQLKLQTVARPERRELIGVSPTVWMLGITSLLTDVSAEMVSSILPVYVVLHLHMSPLQYGAIDGVYNGIAVALLAVAGGMIADRTGRHKEVAAFGYGVSAVCKLLLLVAGTAWGSLAAIVAIDRTGKGARTAPRDALISLASRQRSLATAFAVHRSLDAGGSLIGPLVAFALLAQLPGAFDAVWVISFVCALLGVAVLWLFVENPRGIRGPATGATGAPNTPASGPWLATAAGAVRDARLRPLMVAGAVLSLATISDGFLYLTLQQRGHLSMSALPLCYLATACCYMLLSIPIGRVADRWGRAPVLVGGYVAVGVIYVIAIAAPSSFVGSVMCLCLFGLYYAATEGVLTAMASSLIPEASRTTGLAVVASVVGCAKMGSSLLFGALWHLWGAQFALSFFAAALAAALLVAIYSLRSWHHADA